MARRILHMGQRFKSACTHIKVRTAGHSIFDPGAVTPATPTPGYTRTWASNTRYRGHSSFGRRRARRKQSRGTKAPTGLVVEEELVPFDTSSALSPLQISLSDTGRETHPAAHSE